MVAALDWQSGRAAQCYPPLNHAPIDLVPKPLATVSLTNQASCCAGGFECSVSADGLRA
jgi:hypothetical protein